MLDYSRYPARLPKAVTGYSLRSASTGCSRAARRAGGIGIALDQGKGHGRLPVLPGPAGGATQDAAWVALSQPFCVPFAWRNTGPHWGWPASLGASVKLGSMARMRRKPSSQSWR